MIQHRSIAREISIITLNVNSLTSQLKNNISQIGLKKKKACPKHMLHVRNLLYNSGADISKKEERRKSKLHPTRKAMDKLGRKDQNPLFVF